MPTPGLTRARRLSRPPTPRYRNPMPRKGQPLGEPTYRRCSAKSTRTGQPCKLPPIKGGTVCATHGGAAPQVKRKAEERIAEARARFLDLLDPSFQVYQQALKQGTQPDGQLQHALAAARDAFDRVLGKAVQRNEVGGLDGGPLVVKWES